MTTKRSDLFRPEILEDAVRAGFAGMKALWGTGVAVVNGTLGSTARGDKVQVPYWGNMGELEDLPDDEGNVGQAATIAKITSSAEEATVRHSRKVFEVTKWAEMSVSYGDPYAEAARQIVEMVLRRADRALVDAANATTLVFDQTALPTKTIQWDSVVRAKGLFGDELDAQGGVGLGVMHSKVATDAELLKDAENRPLLVNPVDGSLSRIGGIPFAKSDRLEILPATNPKTYSTLIAKPRSLVFWYNADALTVKTDDDIIDDSTVAAVHVYWAVHMYSKMPGGTKPGVAKIVTQ